MKNMNNKTKKWITVAGCLMLCAVLVGLISTQFRTDPIKDDPLPPQNSQASDVTVETPKTEKEKDVVVTPPEIPASSQPTDNGAVSSGTEQTIQGNASKPAEPTESQKTDPTQKPSGEKVTEPPKPVEHDNVTPPVDPPKENNAPQGGDKKDGQIYVPGFGWIDEIGEGHGTVVDGDGDINKKVGEM